MMGLDFRSFTRSFTQLRAFCIALLVLVLTADAWSQTDGGLSLGLRAGGLIGSTELTDKPHVQVGMALRRPLVGRLLGELGGGYARFDGIDYATDLAVGEVRFLYSPRTSATTRPLAYAGVGFVRYNLAVEPPQRTADVDAIGTVIAVPVGLGVQFVLSNSSALEILGGYTYALSDDINGANYKRGNDVFWGMTVGLTFGAFRPGHSERAPASVPSISEPIVLPPMPVEGPQPVPAATPSLPELAVLSASPEPAVLLPPAPAVAPTSPTVVMPNFAPVYFPTGSVRLSPNGLSLIAEIARAVKLHGVVLLEVHGYADARGNTRQNLKLAKRRAEVVRAALVDQGIEAWRTDVIAIGETEAGGDGTWRSRRVEVVPVE